ncbi:hypothetical protein ACUH7Y_04490 [Clostridium beijerinckii]|uniref:Uncharacterized protein n=1 Tax=Clostridium beijerinckii TaxID=1520 RepID=A0A7X9SK79_CLOBE|nr:hypothetical protein [Clostridium beijerinckii]NMF03474.1 hypothetical protein [Clostridium beijerinckii]
MKKFILNKLLGILVMICTLISIMPTVSKAEENDSIKMDVAYGIEGNFKGSIGIPINVQLENNGEDINGEVEVRVPTNMPNTYDAFTSEINLASKEKRTVSIPINLPENSSKISVVLKQGENILKENTVILSSGRINEADMFMGVLTDDFNGLSIRYLDFTDSNNKSKDEERINKADSVPLAIEQLKSNAKNISSLDVIIINNYNMSNLQKEQYENLSEWVDNGGVLVIGSGENASKTVGNINKEFIDVSYNGMKNINNYTVANLSFKNASTVLQDGGEPLIYKMDKGKGKIYVSTFDLGNQNIAPKDNVMKKWKDLLKDDFLSKYKNSHRHGNNVPYQIEELSRNVPTGDIFKINKLMIVFLIYALSVGIIVYFVMKKLNKREQLWGIIPIIAVGFSIFLYFIGSNTRINDIVLNQVNIIQTDKSGTSDVVGYLGISSKYKNQLKVQEPSGTNLQNYSNERYSDRDQGKNNFTKLASKTVYRENDSYYDFKDLAALDMKKFGISGHKEIVPLIEANLNYDSKKLKGSINNTLGYDIKKLLVVSSNNVWDLGEVKADEKLNVDEDKFSAVGLAGYGDNLEDDYFKNYVRGKNKGDIKEQYKNVLRMSSLISTIGENNISNKSTFLVAITDMPIDYGFDFEKKSVSKYDTTAIIQDVDIDFTDSEGNLNYPLGYFQADITQSDSSIHMETSRNEVYGSGDMILNYSIDNNIDILDLKVGYIGNNKGAKFKGDIYIYNYEKNDYDKINYTAKGESLGNMGKYVKDGKVSIKFHGNDEEGIGIPQIAVKGRAK